MALEAAVIDWLPGARIPSWPGAVKRSLEEAEDTFAVRPTLPPFPLARPSVQQQQRNAMN